MPPSFFFSTLAVALTGACWKAVSRRTAPQAAASEIVALDLRDDRKSLLVQELVTAITRHPEAIVAPLRLCWTRPDGVASKGPKLTDIFVARQAAVVIDIAERQLIGGRYKVPRYVHQSIRNNRAFKASLLNIANEREQPTKAVRAEASEYLREMISIPTLLARCLGQAVRDLSGAGL
jgi:hypothetical protein